MILHVRAVLNIPGHGYSKEQSLRPGRIQRRQLYYGCMGFVSQQLYLCCQDVVLREPAGAGKTKLV